MSDALQKLQHAYRARRAAQEACTHWDYEGHEGAHECCQKLRQATMAVAFARAALRRAENAKQVRA